MPYADPEKKRQVDRDYGNARKEARAARSKAWRLANPERWRAHQRRHHLKRKFGIDQAFYEALLSQQDGRCAICQTTDTAPWEWFTIDHDHITGRIRGLLCPQCNSAIGQMEDDPERLRRAIRYLSES